MPVSPKVLTAVRFEGFELDVRAGELRGPDGGKTRLGEQPLRILIVLLENPGGVVLRERSAASSGRTTPSWNSSTPSARP